MTSEIEKSPPHPKNVVMLSGKDPLLESNTESMQGHDIPVPYSTLDVLNYVTSLCSEMSSLCNQSDLHLLSYFFEMAKTEAQAHRSQLKKTGILSVRDP
jgi:hypothetical protein